MREGRDSVVLPSSLLQERSDDDEPHPPHRMLEQLEWLYLLTSKSGSLQVMLVEGLNTSTFSLAPAPPLIRKP